MTAFPLLAPGDCIARGSIPMEEYHSDTLLHAGNMPSLSCSLASTILFRSPAHAKYEMGGGDGKAPAAHLILGTAAHSVVLTDEGWSDSLVLLPEGTQDYRTKAAQGLRDAALADQKTPLLPKQYKVIQGMRAALEPQRLNNSLLKNGHAEASVWWYDKEFDCVMRCRPDYLPKKGDMKNGAPMVDYKTCPNIANWPAQAVRDLNIPLRLAFYYRGVAAHLGEARPNMRIVYLVQERAAPFATRAYCANIIQDEEEWGCQADEKVLAILQKGEEQLARAVKRWKHALATGEWEGPKDFMPLDLPPFKKTPTAIASDMATEETEDVREEEPADPENH